MKRLICWQCSESLKYNYLYKDVFINGLFYHLNVHNLQ